MKGKINTAKNHPKLATINLVTVRPEPNMLFIFPLILYILQFLKISPIILPNMPIILLLFSSVTHICWCLMKMVTYTKQCDDYTMMYDITTLHCLKSVEEY